MTTTNIRKKYEEEMNVRMRMCTGEQDFQEQATLTEIKTEEPVTEEPVTDYKNVRFFVFPEFKNMHLLEKVREAFPGIDLPNYGPKDIGAPNDVTSINAKLFFSKKDKVDRILDTLCKIGFTIVKRYPFKDIKNKKTGVTTRIVFDDRVILSG